MRFRRATLLLLLVICSLATNAQTDSVNKIRKGISFGLNQFPLNYFRKINGNQLNAVYFGWHIGCFLERPKFNYRAGINFNAYWNYEGYSSHQDVGIEFGIEARLLKALRKWIVNPALLVYVGGIRTHYPSSTFYDLWLMAGPNLCIGRKIGERWCITTETSIGIGAVYYSSNGKMELYPECQFYMWKFVGIGARYYLGNKG